MDLALTLPQPAPGLAGGHSPAPARWGLNTVRFPADLRAWDPVEVLVQRALDAVNGLPVGPGFLLPAGVKRANAGQLLATLAYAYAIGLYGSEEIIAQREVEAGLRYLSSGMDLDSPAIRRFRRAHRGPLSVVLLRLLRNSLAAREAVGLRTADATAGVTHAGMGPWIELCAAEAEARLGRAVFADSVAMDD